MQLVGAVAAVGILRWLFGDVGRLGADASTRPSQRTVARSRELLAAHVRNEFTRSS
jgi:hypothetical protein